MMATAKKTAVKKMKGRLDSCAHGWGTARQIGDFLSMRKMDLDHHNELDAAWRLLCKNNLITLAQAMRIQKKLDKRTSETY